MFYFDKKLRAYEKQFMWDCSLRYLEELYSKDNGILLLNSLIGYSWYYLVEGPCISKKYAKDTNLLALELWKKYIDIGSQEAYNNQFFNYIAGYTLSLHGLFINDEYERKGHMFMKNCLCLTDNLLLQKLAENFLINEQSSKYIPLKEGKAICSQLFAGDSLLENYFFEIYCN